MHTTRVVLAWGLTPVTENYHCGHKTHARDRDRKNEPNKNRTNNIQGKETAKTKNKHRIENSHAVRKNWLKTKYAVSTFII